MDTLYTQHARIFRAFCDENRLRILEQLRHGEKCACVLIEQLGIKQSALSYHMKILVDSGVVESHQVGKWTHYHISTKGSEYAVELIHELTKTDSVTNPDCGCAV